MPTLYLAWQDHDRRRWFPVGRLDADDSTEPSAYSFSYIKGAEEVTQGTPFFPVPGFPELDRRYESNQLFPLFRNRLMNARRPDRPEYLSQLGLDVDDWHPVAELAAPLNRTHSNGFEVFPHIVPDADGKFHTQTPLHGLRYRDHDAITRTASLTEGNPLALYFVTENPETTYAVEVHTQDGNHIGYLPRYLVDGMNEGDAWMVTDVKATVAQVNLDAPLSNRLLVDFRGSLPAGFRPMEHLPQYQPIVPTADYPTNRSSGRKADTT